LFVSGGSCGFSITASPNPVSSRLELTVTKNNLPAEPERPVRVSLLNSNNLTVWSGVISERESSIDVSSMPSSMPSGTYYLKTKKGIGNDTVRIIIER
jgi:hypothetical protein